MSKDATRMYSTWFSVLPLGYCERNLRWGCEPAAYRRGAAESELCCEETPVEAVLLFELGFEVRSASGALPCGGCGERDGRGACDMSNADRDDAAGKEVSDDRGIGAPGFAALA
jgi:hypothetical protein